MEKWQEIEGYEGYYEISNLGRIKSLEQTKENSLGFKFYRKEQILKQQINHKGYCVATLNKEGKRKTLFVHRLVALAFIKNLENKPQVNHIDCNKNNNKVENLEWVTGSENCKHAYDNNLNINLKNKAIKTSKKISCFKDGEKIIFNSINECARSIKSTQANIQRILKDGNFSKNGKYRYIKSHYNFELMEV